MLWGLKKAMLKYFRTIRIYNKNLKEKYETLDKVLSEKYDRKQLPLKIFINAFFGSISAPKVFPWGDMNLGETITCTGRQCLRMVIMYYIKKGYIPITMDTDGICFSAPDDIDTRVYIGKGLNEIVEKGKEYRGIEADSAEFNDTFMRNEMALDIDYTAPAMINISRKNYILLLMKNGKEKIKLTGNTIKSKKLQQYVVEFLDEGFKYLLHGDGLSFINLYYSYVEKIFNHQIPLAKVANRSRVKQSVEDYRKYIKKTTKAGSLMARQAHMELVMNGNYPAALGETIYYVNNGTKKLCGDVKKNPKTGVIDINCYMIPEADILSNPDMTGDYNVSLYMSKFNKHILPLLVVFKPEIRDDILIEDPKDRQYFTALQCELDSGHPLKTEGQDKLDEVMTLSDGEVLYWNRVNRDPFFMYVDDTLSLVDQYWVDYNRKVVKFQADSTKNNEDENYIETDGNDYAYHAINV